MTYDPFENARQEVDQKSGEYSLDVARVVSVPDDSTHNAVVSPLSNAVTDTESGPVVADVAVDAVGDVCLPSEGNLVIVGKFNNGRVVVLKSIYSAEDDVREYTSSERHVGTDANDLVLHGSSIDIDASDAESATVSVGDTSVTVDGNSVHIDTGGDVSVDADTIVSNGGGNIVAAEGDTISGDGHDHGGEVSSDTVSGTIDGKSDGDIEVSE